MKLIIAEKPELARAIALAVLGEEKKQNGYIEKGEYCITWAFGHLLTLKEPEDYDKEKYKAWNISQLPIYFENWEHKEDKEAYKKVQLKVIKNLLKQCDSVIHAGDPDSEGQYLIDEILTFYNNTKPVERLLINDNNTEFIKKSFLKMEDNKKYVSLGLSAYARNVADALLGINATRLFTTLSRQSGGTKTLTVGRVQTPTLGLVISRDYAIEKHIVEKYYELKITANNSNKSNNTVFTYQKEEGTPTNEENLIIDIDYLEKIKEEIKETKKYNVNIISKMKNQNAPLPFNLVKLQAYCNNRFDYSAQKTQDITQILREKYKAITYNRSDSQYLNEEHFLEAPEKLKVISENLGITVENIDINKKSKCFDSSKVTAHHAIIPTNAKININALEEEVANVYKAICDFYIIQFLPACIIEEKTGKFNINEHTFLTRGSKILDAGFKKYLSNYYDDENTDDNFDKSSILNYENGIYEFDHALTMIEDKETRPLKAYTEATLISDMTKIAKYIKNPEIKNILQRKDEGKNGENGSIGTPATRASIINSLYKRGYIEKKGKMVISTKLGREFYDKLPEVLKTADMTALWWLIQEEIIENTKTPKDLILSVLSTVENIIHQTKSYFIETDLIKCSCKSGFLIRKSGKNGMF